MFIVVVKIQTPSMYELCIIYLLSVKVIFTEIKEEKKRKKEKKCKIVVSNFIIILCVLKLSAGTKP